MDPTFLYALAAFSAVFAVAVIAKVASIWKKPDARYEFKMWDGGLMLRGKSIGKNAALTFAIVMTVLALALLYLASAHAERRRRGFGEVPRPFIEKLASGGVDCQPRT
jgi:hypothetical protein